MPCADALTLLPDKAGLAEGVCEGIHHTGVARQTCVGRGDDD